MSRLTRQEMKRDEVREVLSRTLVWVGENFKKIVLGVAALAVVIVAVTWIADFVSGRKGEASEALAAAIAVLSVPLQSEVSAGVTPSDTTYADEAARRDSALEQFVAVAQDYPRSPSARVARAYVAKLEYESGDGARAREIWQELADEGGSDALAAEVELNLIALDRAEGRLEELEARLSSQIDAGGGALAADALLHYLGSVQDELGKAEASSETFQRLVDEHPASPYSEGARQKLAMTAT